MHAPDDDWCEEHFSRLGEMQDNYTDGHPYTPLDAIYAT
jgi:hypothetical protein